MSQVQANVELLTQMRNDLAAHGITEKTGVFGNHKVKLGNSSSIRLDKIKSASIPFAGFRTITKISRGIEGLNNSATKILKQLSTRSDKLNAKNLLGELKAMQTHLKRLDNLRQLTPNQQKDQMWTFTAAVQSLSNRELSAVYQSLISQDMDLLGTALQYEIHTNDDAKDARKAAEQLFDLHAVVLKEISNRSINEQISNTCDDMYLEGLPNNNANEAIARPKSISQEFGSVGNITTNTEAHDITAANLLSMTEIGANSAKRREQSAQTEQTKLNNRQLEDVSIKEIGDVLRKAELTINCKTEFLIGGPNSIFAHPDDPIVNIFHLNDQGLNPKGSGYIDERNSTEKLLFPELNGHNINADERPVYGALNIMQQQTGAVNYDAGYGRSAIVLKP